MPGRTGHLAPAFCCVSRGARETQNETRAGCGVVAPAKTPAANRLNWEARTQLARQIAGIDAMVQANDLLGRAHHNCFQIWNWRAAALPKSVPKLLTTKVLHSRFGT